MSKDIFIYELDGLFGFCDISKKSFIKANYKEVKEFINNITWVKKDQYWHLIDLNEKILLDNSIEQLVLFEKEFSIIFKQNSYFKVNNFTYEVSKINWEFIDFNNSSFLFKDNNKYFFTDLEFNILFETKFDNAKIFNDELAPVLLNGKWGVVDKQGNIVIDFKYDNVYLYAFYLFKVNLNGEDFFIDKKENIYLKDVSKKYLFSSEFSGEGIVFKHKDKYGLMNEYFEILFEKKVDELLDFKDRFAIYKLENKFGLINWMGKKISKPIFDNIFYFTDDYAFVKKDNKYNYFCLSSKKLLF